MKPRPLRSAGSRVSLAPLGAALALVALLGACGGMEKERSGPFGDGSGGAAVVSASVVSQTLSASGSEPSCLGDPLGSLSYDSSYFGALVNPVDPALPETCPPMEIMVLATALPPSGDGIAFTVSRISGREDTACRFLAALLMRDEGYSVLQNGERTNANDLTFYQVDLIRDNLPLSLYCTLLNNNQGVILFGTAPSRELLLYQQVMYVLNSIISS